MLGKRGLRLIGLVSVIAEVAVLKLVFSLDIIHFWTVLVLTVIVVPCLFFSASILWTGEIPFRDKEDK